MSSTHADAHLETTFALIKSDAVGDMFGIIHHAQARGLRVDKIKTYSPLPRPLAEQLYSVHAGQDYYPGVIDSVTGEQGTVVMTLTGPNAVKVWRKAMGATNPSVAAPDTIRAQFGAKNLPCNAVHGSDAVEEAKREMAIFFP
ncbi:NDK domain protein [Mollivirus kamchatka]|nr:NDK domain protein [Mollivirus kamchatka]